MPLHQSIIISLLLVIGSLASTSTATGQTPKSEQDPAILTLDRIYGGSEFGSKGFAGKWSADGGDYTLTEDSKQSPGSRDIVAYDAATGERAVLVPGELFIPNAEAGPLNVESYSFSKDKSLVLIYTNSKRVWRTKSRGDYWILDRSSRVPAKDCCRRQTINDAVRKDLTRLAECGVRR